MEFKIQTLIVKILETVGHELQGFKMLGQQLIIIFHGYHFLKIYTDKYVGLF